MSLDTEEILPSQENDHTQMREELSHMSFEDIKKLKEKLGSKVYNEAIFGQKKVRTHEFKKRDRDAPAEMSAKKQVSRFREVVRVKKHPPRDPRFDSLCGTYDEKAFKKAYSFLNKVKENDLKALKKELTTAEDPKTIKKIKYLIQRIENQLREEARTKQREDMKKAEQKGILEAIEKGEKPHYKKKSEKKILDLVSQYEDLKNSGKLKKHIQRLRKKKVSKDRKKFAQSSEEI